MKLKDEAILKMGGNSNYRLKDTDIVMGIVGNNIGVIYDNNEKLEKSIKSNYCIISTENADLIYLLKSKKDAIKAMAKGSVISKIFLKDLGDLELQ